MSTREHDEAPQKVMGPIPNCSASLGSSIAILLAWVIVWAWDGHWTILP